MQLSEVELPMTRKIRILIVDDEENNAHIISRILDLTEDKVYAIALSGYEALQLVDSFRPDIILLDVKMPDINGHEVCRKIRRGGTSNYAKIIMISGLSSIDERLNGYASGADDYLTKPFVKEELLAKIKVYSKLSRMEELDSMKRIALGLLNHEARTPLNGILLGSELLAGLPGLDRDAKKYADLIRQSGIRIKDLVDKISRYCELQDGVQLYLEEKNAGEEIKELLEEHKDNVSGSTLVLRGELNVLLLSDWELLREAIDHVVINAVEHNPAGETVDLFLEKGTDGLTLSVADKGPGIPEAIRGNIFDGLYTPDLLHHNGGAGLSLAITKEIVTIHQGRVSCHEGEKGGAVFTFFLPFLKATAK